MRSWNEPRRRRASRFDRKRSNLGSRNLIRFRRNREAMVREVTVLLLWGALIVLLARLGVTLWEVGERHLAQHGPLVRGGLPALSVAAAIFAVWRARRNWLEVLDIRREQAELTDKLQEEMHGPSEDPPA